jgi:hypothetical protein
MSSRSRSFRRFGAIVLLFAWAPVATANAVPCAVWCYMNGGLHHHVAQVHSGHHHGGAPASQHDCRTAIGGTHCGTPELMVVAAVAPRALSVPTQAVTAGDPPVASPISFMPSSSGTQTPPPKA